MEGTDRAGPGSNGGGDGPEDRRKRKQQYAVPVKDVRVRPGGGEHEYEFKVRHIRRFIDEGYRVRVSIRAGRGGSPQIESPSRLLERVRADLEDVAKVESGPEPAGGTPTMILTPLESQKRT